MPIAPEGPSYPDKERYFLLTSHKFLMDSSDKVIGLIRKYIDVYENENTNKADMLSIASEMEAEILALIKKMYPLKEGDGAPDIIKKIYKQMVDTHDLIFESTDAEMEKGDLMKIILPRKGDSKVSVNIVTKALLDVEKAMKIL